MIHRTSGICPPSQFNPENTARQANRPTDRCAVSRRSPLPCPGTAMLIEISPVEIAWAAFYNGAALGPSRRAFLLPKRGHLMLPSRVDRRDFLRTSAAGALGASLLTSHASPLEAAPKADMKYKKAVKAYMVQAGDTLADKMKLLAKLGFDGM